MSFLMHRSPKSLSFAAVFIILTAASSAVAQKIPKHNPLTGTTADFYVCWNTGDDSNPGTKSQPFKTPGKAVNVLMGMTDHSGKSVLIRGGLYRLRDDPENRLSLHYMYGKPGAEVQFRGFPGEKVVLDAFTMDFDPLTMTSVPVGWGGVSIYDCEHILVENLTVMGRDQANVSIMNSNYITIRSVKASRSSKHGLFTGGSYHDILIEDCVFFEHMYGPQASHGIYISGGHWDPELPPVRNVTIRNTECFYNGRHGIQFNGRIENIVVENCNLHHNVLGGVSLIGVRNGWLKSNLMYKNNKQGVILSTYFDTSYWDPKDPESVEHWKKTHWACENMLIQNNTIFMDYDPWYDDEWINYKPWYHAGIYMEDSSGLLPPMKNIFIHKNLIYTHSKMMVNIVNVEFFNGVYAFNNFFYSEKYSEGVSCGILVDVAELEYKVPSHWAGNLCGWDPLFWRLTPTVLIDRTNQEIDFSNPIYLNFRDNFHLRSSSKAWDVMAGAFLDVWKGYPVKDASGFKM